MKIAIASDKAGFELKEKIKEHLKSKGWDLEDVGLSNPEDYMSFYNASENLCKRIQTGELEKGILICGTGAGMCINANRYKGIFAVACESIFSARMCRIVNNANVLTMGSNIVGPGLAYEMCDTFLNTEFVEGTTKERGEYLKKLNEEYKLFLEKQQNS